MFVVVTWLQKVMWGRGFCEVKVKSIRKNYKSGWWGLGKLLVKVRGDGVGEAMLMGLREGFSIIRCRSRKMSQITAAVTMASKPDCRMLVNQAHGQVLDDNRQPGYEPGVLSQSQK